MIIMKMAAGKKGKGKGPARPHPQAQTGSGSKTKNMHKHDNRPTDDEMLIFTSDRKKKPGPSNDSPGPAAPRPTVKQIIGGHSWTGKLPVNLLSEHCQRQKWEKPEYSMVTHMCLYKLHLQSIIQLTFAIAQNR